MGALLATIRSLFLVVLVASPLAAVPSAISHRDYDFKKVGKIHKPEFRRLPRQKIPYASARAFLAKKLPSWSAKRREKLLRTVEREADNFGFTPVFVLSVIAVESSFRANVCSHKAACGLMQIQEPTGKAIARKLLIPWRNMDTLSDPFLNIKLGVAYLAQLREEFRHPRLYLSAYNWGPSKLRYLVDSGEVIPAVYYLKVKKKYHEISRAISQEKKEVLVGGL